MKKLFSVPSVPLRVLRVKLFLQSEASMLPDLACRRGSAFASWRERATLQEHLLKGGRVINLFYRQIVLHHGIPFDVKIPNAESREAMREIETGEGLVRFGSAEDLFRDLRI